MTKPFPSSRLVLLMLVIAIGIVYFRIFGAGFVEYDDDIHVYANPFLNPLSLASIGKLWQHAYKGLYIPLAYTILAGIVPFARLSAQTLSSVGQPITLDPTAFHVASLGFHVVNSWLCFTLALRLTRSRMAALLCALVFALHPLQVESVAWISELRGLTSGCFALGALNVFVVSRQLGDSAPAKARNLLCAAALLAVCAVLCKPSAVVLPLVALVIDRTALGTSWRRSLATATIAALCVLPSALITRAVQTIHPEGSSLWWQRPFIAADALTFYLFKTVVPTELGVEYGRTPALVLSHWWSYLAWVLPAGLLAFSFSQRRRHPLAWLGSLLFATFLLPTLGLVPFTFQAHSTVADRYAYLAMLGLGLIVADAGSTIRPKLALRAAVVAIALFAVRSFDQTSYWLDNRSFLTHTLDVNPDVVFANNNIGAILLKEKRIEEAIPHLSKALELDPDHALAQNNLGLALVQEGRLDEAEPHFRKAVELSPNYVNAYASLGALYLRTNRFADAIASLQAAVKLQPSNAKALNDLGIACMQSQRSAEGLDAFRRAVAVEPNNAQYRKNLGIALTQLGQTEEAAAYLGH